MFYWGSGRACGFFQAYFKLQYSKATLIFFATNKRQSVECCPKRRTVPYRSCIIRSKSYSYSSIVVHPACTHAHAQYSRGFTASLPLVGGWPVLIYTLDELKPLKEWNKRLFAHQKFPYIQILYQKKEKLKAIWKTAVPP